MTICTVLVFSMIFKILERTSEQFHALIHLLEGLEHMFHVLFHFLDFCFEILNLVSLFE